MDKFSKLNIKNREFVNQFKENFEFGIPIKSPDGNELYPIYHEHLFLRYYVSYTGLLYDNVTGEYSKHLMDEMISFNSTDSSSIIELSMREVIWRSFYRFENGKDAIDPNNLKITQKNKNGIVIYNICGVQFYTITFPKENKCRLAISKNGCIYNIDKRRIVRLHLNNSGKYFFIGKNNSIIEIGKLLGYAFFQDRCNIEKMKIDTTAQCMLFIHYKNIILHNSEMNISVADSILQNTDFHPMNEYNFEKFDDDHYKATLKNRKNLKFDGYFDEHRFGKLYSIPIPNMEHYKITKSGILYAIFKKEILTPIDVFGNPKSGYDILYYIPELKMNVYISNLLLWTFYRLNYLSIGFISCNLLIDKEYRIPFIANMIFSPKVMIPFEDSYYIGDEEFIKIHNSESVFISKNGALYNSSSKYFSEIITVTKGSRDIPLAKTQIKDGISTWSKVYHVMYSNWISKYPNYIQITTRNGIPGDTSLMNLTVNVKSSLYSTSKVKLIDCKSAYNAVQKLKEVENKKITEVYKTSVITDIPQPYFS